MTNVSNAANDAAKTVKESAKEFAETIETVTEEITEEIKPGFFGRAFNAVKNNPFKTVAVVGAIAGASYVVATKVLTGAIDEVPEAAEEVVAAFMPIVSFFRA